MITKSRADRSKGTRALVVLAVIMAAGLLGSCTGAGAHNTEPAKLVVNGAKVEVPYVLSIDGKNVSLEEYRYYFLNTRCLMDKGDKSYWKEDPNGSLQQKLKIDTLKALKETYAVEFLAEELKLSLSKDELSQIDNDVKNQISTLGGSIQYKQALGENHLTDALYRNLWKINFYCEKLWVYYFSKGGEYHNSDSSFSEDEINDRYSMQFQSIVSKKAAGLTVEFGPEYDIINVDSLT